MSTVKAIVRGKEVVIENVVSIEQERGDVDFIYDMCGGPYGNGPSVCPDCRKKYESSKKASFCGKRFVAFQVESSPGMITVNTEMITGKFGEITIYKSIPVSKIIEVNGNKWEAE